MRAASYGAFDERGLGYLTFREFLDDAAEHGVIKIIPPAPGQDYRLYLPGSTALAEHTVSAPASGSAGTPQASSRTTHKHIRSDLWATFIDWNESLRRVYDVQARRAYRIPAEPGALEPKEITELRQQADLDPKRFRTIPRVSQEIHLGWMRQFVHRVEDASLRTFLESALDGERPAAGFRTALRAYPREQTAWTTFLIDQLAERIAAFGRDEGLDIDPFEEEPREPLNSNSAAITAQPDAPAPSETLTPSIDQVRAKLHAAIDVMPLQDLLALKVPVGYLLTP